MPANTAQQLREVPRKVQAAVTAAEREIARIAAQIERLQQRIIELRGFIKSSSLIFEGIEEATAGGTYAEVATNLLRAVGQPMTTSQLVEAMANSGRPINGASRKHRIRTLIISLTRAPAIVRRSKGWWLRGVPMPTESGHGS